ncbi:hypothetical protein [Micromonospora sp. DT47]|uniref:hypothetical protein n=1 Tax=Micromonospora sp. DT47 TaxID=3393431 RepID=UPI003CE6FA59
MILFEPRIAKQFLQRQVDILPADRLDLGHDRRNAVPGELLVRLRVERVAAFTGIAD